MSTMTQLFIGDPEVAAIVAAPVPDEGPGRARTVLAVAGAVILGAAVARALTRRG